MSWKNEITRKSISRQDTIPEQDMEMVIDYLEEKERNSHGSFLMARNALFSILYRVAPRPVVEMDFRDLDNVVRAIDIAPYKKNTKMQRWSTIKAYYEWCLDRLRRNGIKVENQLPLRVKFNATQNDVSIDNDEGCEIFSDHDLARLETRAQIKGMKWHVAFLLLKHCGMRGSELATIKLRNVNVEERVLVTGLERDARKSKKPLTFFFPPEVAAIVMEYIETLPKECEWLFPGITTPCIRRTALSRLFGKTHSFRKTLITRRIDNGCPYHISEMLVNHEISSVEFKHYYKKPRNERRDLYDKYHPF